MKKYLKPIPLRVFLIVPFVLQIVGTVALVGYFCRRSSEKTIERLANPLIQEINDNVKQELNTYLSSAQKMVEDNVSLFENQLIDWQNSEKLGHYFWHLLKNHNLEYLRLRTIENEYVGVGYFKNQLEITERSKLNLNKLYAYAPDSQGHRHHLLNIYDEDNPLDAVRFTEILKNNKAGWSSVYQQTDDLTQMGIRFNAPVYTANKQLVGLLGVDISLKSINRFLANIAHDYSGIIFMVDREGYLIGNSQSSPLYVIKKGEAKRRLASESSDSLIKFVSQSIFSTHDYRTNLALKSLTFQTKNYWVKTVNYQDKYGLNGLIVTLIPSANFRSEIDKSNQLNALIIFSASALSLIIGVLTARWITRPILQLNKAAKNLARGDWEHSLTFNRTDEIGELALSFADMTQQLKTAFRTIEENKNQLHAFLDNLPIGIFIIEKNNRVLFINQAGQTTLGKGMIPDLKLEDLSTVYHIYQTDSDQLYSPQKLSVFKELSREILIREDLEIRQENGSTIPLEVRTIPILNLKREMGYVINTFVDISERKTMSKLRDNYQLELEQQIHQQTRILQESEERFRRSFEDAPIGMVITTIKGQLVQVNRALCGILGYSEQELCALTFQNITHPDDLDTTIHYLKQLLLGKIHSFQLEKRYLHKEGYLIYSFVCVSLVKDKDGNPLYFIGQIKDITQRKQAETELKRRNEEMEAIFQAFPDLLFRIYLDGQGKRI